METRTEERPDGLYQRAQTRATPLLSKLADLSDDEWEELTYRMRKHFMRVMRDGGYVIHKADPLGPATSPPTPTPTTGTGHETPRPGAPE